MDADIFLRIWAVLGPLLAASGSALWSRHIQVQDRIHSDAREDFRMQRNRELHLEELNRQWSSRTYEEAKTAIADFMSMSHVAVRRLTTTLHLKDTESMKSSEEAVECFTRCGQLVMLLGDDLLERATTNLWNLALETPASQEVAKSPEWIERLDKYKAARVAFNREANTRCRLQRADSASRRLA